MAIIYLTRFPERPALLSGFSGPLPSISENPIIVLGATITRGFLPASAGKVGRQPSLCFVLHHMGFFVRLRLRERPVGSYPAFSPLPSTTLGLTVLWNQRLLGRAKSGAGRYIFCDTIRHPGFTSWAPPISRGMLPFGVRTFLWQNKCQASDHPPRSRK